jgi:transcription antitermination factor NusG
LIERRLWQLVLPLLRLHELRGELEALLRACPANVPEAGDEHRNPQNKETGKKQRKLFPFMNLLFAYMTEQEAEKYVRHSKMSQYTTYYYNHFVTDKNGHNPPLTVRSKDMEPLVRVTALLDEHVMEIDTNTCRFLSNDLVRINDGPFKDITGRVARIAGQRRVVITIKGLQSGLTTAYIPPYCLEKIENEESV